MLRGIGVSTLIAALAAGAAWAEEPVAFPGADEFGVAALKLERALAAYDTDIITSSRHIERATRDLLETARRYKYTEGSPQREFILRTQERLEAIGETVYERLWHRNTSTPEEIEREKATISCIVDELYAMGRGDPLIRPEISSDYEELRAEVKENEAAGKGDIETQIEAFRAEAARLNEEAEAVEAENRRLEERAMKVTEVMDFWKSIIGDDQAATTKWDEF